MAHPRIVSLLPSATEIAVALGLGQNLVGRSHECDYPPFVKGLPVVTSTKLEKGLTSCQIDDRVQGIVRQGLSVYEVDTALLRDLRPDLILTQSQCAVCAVTPADLEEALSEERADCLNFIECIVDRDDCSKELLEWGSRVAAANGRPPNPQ